jgi:DNA-binding transcriptional regulator YdaS (Cro superfamily)
MSLQKAIDHFGGPRSLADKLGLKTTMAISQWKKRGIPLSRALEIEELSGGAISFRDLVNKKESDA